MKRQFQLLNYTAAFMLAFSMTTATTANEIDHSTISVDVDGVALYTTANSSHEVLSVNLRIVGEGDFIVEKRVESSNYLDWIPPSDMPDGLYHWEAWTVTVRPGAPVRDITPALFTAEQEHAILDSGATQPTVEIPLERHFPSEYKEVQKNSGTFRIDNGYMTEVDPFSEPLSSAFEPTRFQRITTALLDFFIPSATAQTTINNDLQIEKVNPQIFFDDTRDTVRTGILGNMNGLFVRSWDGATFTGGHFQLWRSNLGSDALVIRGSTDTARPNRIGIGTATPTEILHLRSNAPIIRFEDVDDAQNWRLLAGGGGYRVHDATEDTVPFRIATGADDLSLTIGTAAGPGVANVSINAFSDRTMMIRGAADKTWPFTVVPQNSTRLAVHENGGTAIGNFTTPPARGLFVWGDTGIGTNAPDAAFHVRRTNGTAGIILEETQAIATNNMFNMRHNGNPGFLLENSGTGAEWQFRLGGSGGTEQFTVNKTSIAGPELQVMANGNMIIKGSYLNGSSRSIKQDIIDVNEHEVLEYVSKMPIYEWSYKTAPESRHIGPMAEDYHEMFGLAGDGTALAATDMAGLALVSVKALHSQVQALREENDALRARIEQFDEMESRMAVLESRLTTLAGIAKN